MRSESKVLDFENLSEKYQIEIAEYYEEVLEENKRKLELMTSENSLQLIYQLTILLYEYKVKLIFKNITSSKFSILRFMNWILLHGQIQELDGLGLKKFFLTPSLLAVTFS